MPMDTLMAPITRFPDIFSRSSTKARNAMSAGAALLMSPPAAAVVWRSPRKMNARYRTIPNRACNRSARWVLPSVFHGPRRCRKAKGSRISRLTKMPSSAARKTGIDATMHFPATTALPAMLIAVARKRYAFIRLFFIVQPGCDAKKSEGRLRHPCQSRLASFRRPL